MVFFAAPLIGAIARMSVGKIATHAVKSLGSKEASKFITKAGNNAAKTEMKTIAAEAAEKGLKGEERKKYIKANQNRVSETRHSITDSRNAVKKGARDSRIKLPDALVSKTLPFLEKGDIKGATRTIESYISSALTSAATGAKSGRAYGFAVDVKETVDKAKDVQTTIDGILSGKTVHAAAKSTVEKGVSFVTGAGSKWVEGETLLAKDVAALSKAVKKANNHRAKLRKLTSQPEWLVNKIMNEMFGSPTDMGEWTDENGSVWTPEDIEAMANNTGDGPAPAREIDPMYANLHSMEKAMTSPVKRMVASHKQGMDNFIQSMESAGMKDSAPTIYSDIIEAMSVMSPATFAYVVGQSPRINGRVWTGGKVKRVESFYIWYSSDVNAFRKSMMQLIDAFDLDEDDYDWEEKGILKHAAVQYNEDAPETGENPMTGITVRKPVGHQRYTNRRNK